MRDIYNVDFYTAQARCEKELERQTKGSDPRKTYAGPWRKGYITPASTPEDAADDFVSWVQEFTVLHGANVFIQVSTPSEFEEKVLDHKPQYIWMLHGHVTPEPAIV